MTTARTHTPLNTSTEMRPEPQNIWANPYDSAVNVTFSGTAEGAQVSWPSILMGRHRDVDSTSQEECFGLLDSGQEDVTTILDSTRGIVVTDDHLRHVRKAIQLTPVRRISVWKQLRELEEAKRGQDVSQSGSLFLSNAFLPHDGSYKFRADNERLEEMKGQIHQLLEMAGYDDWDGEGAQAVTKETLKVAEDIANVLPHGVETPEISATPQGEVDFDWIVSSSVMMTVSACPSKEVAFAAIFENARVRDRQAWNGHLTSLLTTCFEMLFAAFAEARR